MLYPLAFGTRSFIDSSFSFISDLREFHSFGSGSKTVYSSSSPQKNLAQSQFQDAEISSHETVRIFAEPDRYMFNPFSSDSKGLFYDSRSFVQSLASYDHFTSNSTCVTAKDRISTQSLPDVDHVASDPASRFASSQLSAQSIRGFNSYSTRSTNCFTSDRDSNKNQYISGIVA